MSTDSSLLDQLRKYSAVACDSLDPAIGAQLGPFAGATSNQFIVLFELLKEPDVCAQLLQKATDHAIKFHDNAPEKRVSASVKLLMIFLVQRMLPYLVPEGKVFIQASMRTAHSTQATLADAREIIDLARSLPDGGDALASRICVKLPSTFEALSAAPELKSAHGIATLGTALFSLEQAALAHQVGCEYISPYVNELRMHFNKDEVDNNKLYDVIRSIWKYFHAEDVKSRTILMPASFIIREDVLEFTGVDGLTIPAHFLTEFASTPSDPTLCPTYSKETTPAFSTASDPRFAELAGMVGNESKYKELFAKNVQAVRKLDEAIAKFLEYDEKLEDLVRVELEKKGAL